MLWHHENVTKYIKSNGIAAKRAAPRLRNTPPVLTISLQKVILLSSSAWEIILSCREQESITHPIPHNHPDALGVDSGPLALSLFPRL